jgi:hypothetical protein
MFSIASACLDAFLDAFQVTNMKQVAIIVQRKPNTQMSLRYCA